MDALLQTAFQDSRTAAFSVGVGTVVLTHTAMLVLPGDNSSKMNHAMLNLAAAAAIVYGSRIFG